MSGPTRSPLSSLICVSSIAGTRQAYNLAGPLGRRTRIRGLRDAANGRDDLTKNAATLRDARIWDWRALEPQLQQIQGLRPYYTFPGVDIDRYRDRRRRAAGHDHGT